MALTRKNLLIDAEQLASLATRRGLSESSVVREVIADALFADGFMVAMTALHETGYGEDGSGVGLPAAPPLIRPLSLDTTALIAQIAAHIGATVVTANRTDFRAWIALGDLDATLQEGTERPAAVSCSP